MGKRIAVVAAMRNELKPFTRRVTDGHIGDADVSGTVIGIGPALARSSTEQLLDAGPVDHVVMIGIAGGVGPTVKIGDVVVPEVVLDADGGEHRPVALPGTSPHGLMRTSGNIDVTDAEVAALRESGVIALDMETAAVGAVCEERGVPWSVVRAISDHTDDGFVDSRVLAMTNSDGSPNMKNVARYVLPRPWKLVQLSKLAKGAGLATRASADAAADAIAALVRSSG